MSGNSACSRVQTLPIVSSRWSFRSGACAVLMPSVLQEDQLVLADLDLVAVLELPRLDPAPVQERAVQAALVLDHVPAVLLGEHGMLARHGHVVQEDVAV